MIFLVSKVAPLLYIHVTPCSRIRGSFHVIVYFPNVLTFGLLYVVTTQQSTSRHHLIESTIMFVAVLVASCSSCAHVCWTRDAVVEPGKSPRRSSRTKYCSFHFTGLDTRGFQAFFCLVLTQIGILSEDELMRNLISI